MPKTPTILQRLCQHKTFHVNPATLGHTLTLAVEIAREGREGRKIGTIFTVGDHLAVLECSRPLILDPLLGHPDDRKHIDASAMRETIKELAQLDGGFVVSDDGVVVSAARYFYSDMRDLDLPLGLGARHIAGASISRTTKAVAVVVSESEVVRLFDNGELISEILPELWMLQTHEINVPGQPRRQTQDGLTVVSRGDSSVGPSS